MNSGYGHNEKLESIYADLKQADEQNSIGKYGDSVTLVESAVRKAVLLLEETNNVTGFGKKLQDRFAAFTDDFKIINAAQVIENLFDPALIPTGFDQGTEEPDISPGHAEKMILYGKKLVEFVNDKLI